MRESQGISRFIGSKFKSIPQRYVLAVMSSLAIIAIYMTRIVLAISMTQMVKRIVTNHTTITDEFSCPMLNAASVHRNSSEVAVNDLMQSAPLQQYEWSQELQGYILSSFYVGYVVMHMPYGLLSERIGGKPVILIAMFLSAALSIATPFAVRYGGPYGLMLVRFLLGSVQAGLYPSIATLLAAWIPKIERGRIGSMVYCAAPCGTIIGNFTAGMLMHHFKTWHVGFYAFGGINIVMGLLYAVLCSSNPASHPFITDDEKNFLRKEIGQLEKDKSHKAIPWKALITNVPVIALVLTIVVGDWAYYTILIDLPKYMNDILHVSIKDNGIFSSLPWVMYIVVSLASGVWSDHLISSERMSITNARKLLITISSIIGGAFIMAAAYGGCSLSVVGSFFAIAVGAQGFLSASLFLNAMDLCPNFAGVLTGIVGAIACCMGILVPVVVSYLTPNSLQSEWRIVFWITLFASIAQLAVFDIWGSAKVQLWNNPATQPLNGHSVEGQTNKTKPNNDTK